MTIVSDNGPCFTSQEFKTFLEMNGVRHVTSSVYKPATNGLAERMVQTFKNSLKGSKDDYKVHIDKFLFKYRITPHTTTGVSPSELMFKRKLRCRLDLLHPSDVIGNRVAKRQEMQKKNHVSNPRHLEIDQETPVLIRNYSTGPKWIPASIDKQTGPLSYHCQLEDGRVVKRHQDQLITGGKPLKVSDSFTPVQEPLVPEQPSGVPEETSSVETPLASTSTDVVPEYSNTSQPSQPTPPRTVSQTVTPLRRSTRNSRPPKRLNL